MEHIITYEGTEFNLDKRLIKLKDGKEMTFEHILSLSQFISQLRHYEIFLRMEEEIQRPTIQLWKETK